jgi:hypothetical protein
MENINPKAVYLIAITRRRKIWKERSCFGIHLNTLQIHVYPLPQVGPF